MRLVEREELLTRLASYLDEAQTTGRFVLVAGEAGVGKTSLVRRLLETGPGDFRVLWGACDPLSTPRPLGPFLDMSPLAAILEAHRGKHGLLAALVDELTVGTLMVVEDSHGAV